MCFLVFNLVEMGDVGQSEGLSNFDLLCIFELCVAVMVAFEMFVQQK